MLEELLALIDERLAGLYLRAQSPAFHASRNQRVATRLLIREAFAMRAALLYRQSQEV